MQSLDLDYSKAIISTMQFTQNINSLNKQLAGMKANAMTAAKDINTVFASQLGQKGNQGLVDQWGKPMRAVREEVEKTSKSYEGVNRQIKQSTLATLEAKAAATQQYISAKGLSQEYSSQAGTIRSQIGALKEKLQVEGKLSAQEKNQTAQLKEQLSILRSQAAVGVADAGSSNHLGSEWDRRASWFITGTVFYGMVSAGQEAVRTIKSVEMGVTEIARVMEDSSFVFEDYRDKLLQLGVDYGQTFDTVQNIALRWAQSGYNVADSLELATSSLLALNTAELDATSATESMIGIMAQWQLQASDLELVMDKINKTADNYTVTSQDLVDGLLRSSGAARVMNLTLDETVGLLTVMRESSGRTGREVGNALNSILSYVQRPVAINTMERMGIKVFADEAKTQFRSAMEIFKDIGVNWGSLSAEIQDGFVKSADDAGLFNDEMAESLGMQAEWNNLQQRDISQAAAGVYRRNYFIGMIERMSSVQGVLNGMMDAEGYSMRENERTMGTLEKQHQSLTASMEALAVAMGDAGALDIFKGMVSGATSAAEAITKLNPVSRDLLLGFMNVVLVVKTLETGLKTFGIVVPGVSAAIKGLTTGMVGLRGAVAATTASLGVAFVANAPLIAVAALIAAAVALWNQYKRVREEQKQFIESTKENIVNLKAERNELASLASEYETLKAKKSNLTANSDEKKRLLEIQKQLVEQYDVSIAGIDAEGKAYADSTIAIKNRIQALEEMEAAERDALEMAIMAGEPDRLKTLEKSFEKIKGLGNEILSAQSMLDEYRNALSGGDMITGYGGAQIDTSTTQGEAIARNYIKNLSQTIIDLNAELGKLTEGVDEATSDVQQALRNYTVEIANHFSEDGAQVTDNARMFITEMADAMAFEDKPYDIMKKDLEDYFQAFTGSDMENLISDYQKSVANNDAEGVHGLSQEILALANILTGANPKANDYLAALEGMYPPAINATNATFDLKTAMDSLDAVTKTSSAGIKPLNQAIDDLRKGQSLSADTILDLIDKYDLSESSIKKTVDGYRVEITALEDLRQDKIKTFDDAKQSTIADAQLVVTQTGVKLEAYGLEISKLGDLAEARAILDRRADESAKQKLRSDSIMSYMPLAGKDVDMSIQGQMSRYYGYYNEYAKGAQADLKAYEKAVSELRALEEKTKIRSSIINNPKYGVSSSGNNSKGSTSSTQNKALSDALRILEHRKRISTETVALIEDEITELNRIANAYARTTDEQMDMIEKIYSAEQRLSDKKLQHSTDWIAQKKALGQLSVDDELAAYKRILDAQGSNHKARLLATENIYRLEKQLADDTTKSLEESYSNQENYIQHWAKLGVYGIQQQIDKYKELHDIKTSTVNEEMKQTEKMFDLYKSLLGEEQRKIKDAYDDRIQQIEDESKVKKDAQDEVIKGIEKELSLLSKQEEEYSHDKKMSDLREQLAYWSVRTSEDARKKVAELTEQIAEEERKREVELKKEGLEDKKKIAEDEIKAIDDAAKEETENWKASYKLVEDAFSAHSVDIVSLAGAMSEEAYKKWVDNYLTPLQNSLASGNFASFDAESSSLSPALSGIEQQQSNNRTQVYQLSNSILSLKKQWTDGNKSASQSAVPIYDELSKLSPSASNVLHQMDYEAAKAYVAGLPKMHGGGKSLSYGAVEMMPGELTFPPDLSTKLESLISVLYSSKLPQLQSQQSYTTDKRIIQYFNAPLFNSEKTVFEDETDMGSMSRELQRAIVNMN